MQIKLILTSVAFATYIYFGMYVLLADYRSYNHRFFFYLCLAFALWSFSHIMVYSGILIMFFSHTAFFACLLYVYFGVKLFISFTGYYGKFKPSQKILFKLIIMIPIIILSYLDFIAGVFDVEHQSSPWYLLFHVVLNIYNIVILGVITVWGIKSKYKREKKQAFLIVSGAILVLILDYIFEFLHFARASSFLIVIWIFCVWYAMTKYRFLALTPETVGTKIFNQVGDFVFLLNKDYELLYSNPKARHNEVIIDKGYFKTIFIERNLGLKIQRSAGEDKTINSQKLILPCTAGQSLLVNARFSLISDTFGDLLGVLVVAGEIKGMDKIKTLYGISSRETDIIRHVLTGNTNKQIAGFLYITESTVKAHLTSIYNKIGIDNKVQLLNAVLEP